ncbi:hypothetical protein FQA39_LY17476, partial [Lamprigera yunnana]
LYIIQHVDYTEIDWKTYMQEVEGFLNGTFDYKLLKGDTGPLVYPAGFVYIYSVLYFITSQGSNILLAQYIFLILYLIQTYLVFQIYIKTAKIPPYALIFTTLTSYRMHSIYVLRLFNDPVAILLFYISLHFFLDNKWIFGSIFYSLAVSVKMNILLFAPCLLGVYLTNLSLKDTAVNLCICGMIQLILGIPFILTNCTSYLISSFDFGRVFEHKWTVNYRFLTIDVFKSSHFHLSLLVTHICLLVLFTPPIKRYLSSYAKLNCVKTDLFNKKKQSTSKFKLIKFDRNVQLFVLPFFVTNLIGVICARSLHYQFYCWYFHSLVYLAFSTTFRKPLIFCILGVIELCWNTYPSTSISSVLLHVCHITLLYGV